MLIDAYLQLSRPSYAGGWKPWAFTWKYQKLYGMPMPIPGSTTRPRIVRAVHLRILGVLAAMSLQYNTDGPLAPAPAANRTGSV